MAQTSVSQSTTNSPVNRSTRSYLRDGLLIVSATLMAVTLYMVFLWVPTEQNLGVSQRIFYFHVPLGWIGMVSIIVVAVASFMHLITGREKWDSLAYATAELGVIFATLILVTGAVWAKPVWGVWWTWDAKLTTTLVLWFIYIGYLMIRAYGPTGTQGKRYASVIALIGAVDAPIIYKATDWWRSAHPERNTPSDLASEMLLTLLVAVVTFTILYAYLLIERYHLRKSESDLDDLHQRTA
ncbi:MAG: cytochrome c biogenesis protein CcsA [SAR202 cluster bacterium]|nr:cytochrome c biogenesis protein CcsA [SAR202 cluster bacterium]MDP6513320.1 cytochrome c biogenesis protein CcsA [SAR202 cluster bacterium]MDP6716812.1 cytochrome c biogenesis protein CcsA [SAR202 cluster bacterium]